MSTAQAQAPARARRPGRGEPPPTFDRIQIVIIEEDGEVELVLGAASRLVARGVPAVGVGLRLLGVHGAQSGGRAAGGGRGQARLSPGPSSGVAKEAGSGAERRVERRGHCPRGNARRVRGRRAWRSGSWTLPRELSGGGSGAGFLLREAPVAARGGERGGGDSAAGSAGAGPPPRDLGREGGREGRSGGRAQEEGGRPLALAALPGHRA